MKISEGIVSSSYLLEESHVITFYLGSGNPFVPLPSIVTKTLRAYGVKVGNKNYLMTSEDSSPAIPKNTKVYFQERGIWPFKKRSLILDKKVIPILHVND